MHCTVCVCVYLHNHHLYTNPNCCSTTPSVLVNMSGTGLRQSHTTFPKVMEVLNEGLLWQRACKDVNDLPSLAPDNNLP